LLGVLHQVGHDLHDLIAIGVQVGTRLGFEVDGGACGAVQRDDAAHGFFGVEGRGGGRGQAGEAGELADDVADARDLVQHRARGLVEVFVEGGVVAGAQPP
jgi:hypothetical protein